MTRSEIMRTFSSELRSVVWHFLRYSFVAIALVIAAAFWIAIGEHIASWL